MHKVKNEIQGPDLQIKRNWGRRNRYSHIVWSDSLHIFQGQVLNLKHTPRARLKQLGQWPYTLCGKSVENLRELMSLFKGGTESWAKCAYLKIKKWMFVRVPRGSDNLRLTLPKLNMRTSQLKKMTDHNSCTSGKINWEYLWYKSSWHQK
jgi:hypothetical protein